MRQPTSILIFSAALALVALEVVAADAFHGNTNSRVYHSSSCRYYNCAHCTTVFASVGDPESKGIPRVRRLQAERVFRPIERR